MKPHFWICFITSLISLSLFSTLNAQNNLQPQLETPRDSPENIALTGIVGSAIGDDHISLAELKLKAVEDAKVNALFEAGIEERITRYQDYYVADTKDKYQEIFTSDFLSDLRGVVKSVKIITENVQFNEFGNLEATVVIDAVVLKYHTEKDLLLSAEIKGILSAYEVGDHLTFSIFPSSDLYMKVFWLGDSSEGIVFPNSQEKSTLFSKATRYDFPMKSFIKYEVTSELKKENNRLIFVFLKDDIPYLEDFTYDSILNWIYEIPIHKRTIVTKSFIAVK